MKYPYLLTFCRNNLYKTNLFPNFNFNHWLEANIGNYEDVELKIDVIGFLDSNLNLIKID